MVILTKTEINDINKPELVDAYLDLQDKHEKALEEVEQKDKSIKEADDRIDELEDKLESVPEGAVKPTFTVGKKSYELTMPKFRHPDTGGTVDAEALKKDSMLLKMLLEMKFAGLKEVQHG